ncbi:hypothetical protein N7456_001405 [Penicillium angulare]|uniref:Stress-response A/B barrel domain-containing protein n=1 Tax=Penicillium angulare TaxID=116970 RepID=A0A9W9G667_9EURO|nr:hypothetical protein N7456_001405 [Penicillium angulare]
MKPVTHIVLLQFTPEVTETDRQEVAIKIQGLKDDCVHPQTGKRYMLSMKAGMDMSIEGSQRDITHAFVSKFSTTDDRDYFVQEDLVHMALVKAVKSKLRKVQVVDFIEGDFI